jgi:alpha-glucoside transport system permease protein
MNAQTKQRIREILGRIPLHLIIIVLCLLWLLPTVGLLVSSLRPVQAVNTSGWWSVFAPSETEALYTDYCASCHGADGSAIAGADLSDPALIETFRRSSMLRATFDEEYEDGVHIPEEARPNPNEAADILDHLRILSGVAEPQPTLTIDNYIDALAGYRGQLSYREECASGEGAVPGVRSCNFWEDLFGKSSLGLGFINSLIVSIPATILPILIAAFAAYAFSWLDFWGRRKLFALLVGLQVVPIQMTLIPIYRIYTDLGLNGSFLGVWLFHTGFGLPYAIYLMRTFIASLPTDLFESAYLDGADHWTAFWRLVVPLSVPAIASLAIFQFIWVWNDLLVALVFLGGTTPVITYQIANMVTSMGAGWHLLTAAAFISMLLPMVVFLLFQRYFVRGMLAGSIKGGG